MGGVGYGFAAYGEAIYGAIRATIAGRGGGTVISGELWRATINGTLVEDLSDVLVSGWVDWDYGRAGGLFGSPEGTAMMCGFDLRAVNRVTPLVDFLAPFINIAYLDGRPPIRQQLGLFAVDPPPERHDALTGIASLTGQDLTSILRDTFFTGAYTVANGAQFDTSIRTIIQDGGISKHNVRESTKTLGYARKHTTTWSRLAAANRLAHAAGWYRLFCDLSGWPTTLPYRSFRKTHPAAVYTRRDPVDILTVDPQGRPANTVIVHAQRQGRSTLKSVKQLDEIDPTHPYAVANLGRQRVYGGGPIIVDDIEDQDSLDAFALSLVEEAVSWEQIVTMNVLPDPHPDILRTVDLDFGGDKDHLDGRYHLRYWRVGFVPEDALMTLRLHRVVRGRQQLEALAS